VCDTAVVVLEGLVLFAKNSDRDPNEAQALDWVPARRNRTGARVRCTHLEIDDVKETHAVLLSRPFWMWGAEMGANEHGVVAGNEAVFTREPVPEEGGLTGMDLLRLALERASTARQAVEVAIGLHERHGQGGRMGHERRTFRYWSSFIFADATEAYVLETAGRNAWEVERVAKGARTISNALTIGAFADTHGARMKTHFARALERRACTTRHASAATSAADLMAMLRDHGDAGAPARDPSPRWELDTGAMRAPCMHAGGLVASSQSVASWVSELRPGAARHWATATAAPCTSIFKPVSVNEPVDLGPWPTDRFDARTPWWRHELLHRTALRAPARAAEAFARERDALEAAWLASPPSSARAFAEADARLRRWTRAVAGVMRGDDRPFSVRRYWAARNRRAGLPRA
jgi:dipeptidase